MSTYVKTTDFLAKDSLPLNNAGKYVKGSEIDTEFDNIATADADNLKISSLGTNVQTALRTNIGSAGAPVLFNGAGGTPSSIVLTNATGTAASLTAGTASAVAVGGITGLGANVATALAVAVGSAGAPVVFNGALGTPSSGNLANCTGYPAQSTITIGTMQASTSGTSIDFGSIPAGVKRITIMFDGVSTNSGTTQMIVRIGDSGGIETSGYVSAAATAGRTDGFSVSDYGGAANLHTGKMVLDLMNAATFKWVASGAMAISDVPQSQSMGGVKSLTAALDRLSITTSAGTATFDSGSINISYES